MQEKYNQRIHMHLEAHKSSFNEHKKTEVPTLKTDGDNCSMLDFHLVIDRLSSFFILSDAVRLIYYF